MGIAIREGREVRSEQFKLRRQMVESRVETHNQVMAVLTPERRNQARQCGPWWATEEE